MSADESRRAELVAAAVGDDLTAAERAELDRMIAADPSVAEEVEALSRVAVSLAALRSTDDTVAPAVSIARRRRSPRRFTRILVAASVGLVVGVGATLGAQSLSGTDPVTGPPGTLGAFEPTTFTSTDGSAQVRGGLVAHTWGTETVLEMTGLVDRAVYELVLLDKSGSAAPSGSFVGTNAEIDCRMNAALDRTDVRTIEIRTEGRTVASASVPPVG